MRCMVNRIWQGYPIFTWEILDVAPYGSKNPGCPKCLTACIWLVPQERRETKSSPNHHIPDGRMQPASVRLVDGGWMRQLSFRLWRGPLGSLLGGPFACNTCS